MGKRGKTVNFSLPKEIIQHIQSFMSGKEATQTSLLSKSWYTACFTRPNLDFNQRDFLFGNQEEEDSFWGFAKKTIQRYEELKLRIESFRLCIYRMNSRSRSLAKEVIAKAFKMGVVEFDFGVEGFRTLGSYTPPIILESKTIIRLSAAGIELDLGVNRNVSCSRFRSLSLENVSLSDHNSKIWDIISVFPLIDKLTLSKCCGMVSLVVDVPRNLSSLNKVKCLFLVEVDVVDPLFFSDVLSNFPCLKVLSLENCSGYNCKGIKISSRLLECITFKQKRLLRANFDVPSIRKFEFVGWKWPSVSFTTKSRNWESDISVTCHRPSTGWFLKLQELLTSLSLSKVSLSLTIWDVVEKAVSFQGLRKPAVENLTMRASPSARSSGMECLLQVCRPKSITLYLLPELGRWKKGELKTTFLAMLWKRSVQGVGENWLMENQNECGLHDLEEVNAEYFSESVAEWRPLLLDVSSARALCSATGENLRKIRFQLRWPVDPVSLNEFSHA